MKKLAGILIAVGTVAGTVGAISSAQAATYPLGIFTPGVGQVVENVGTGAFTDTYTFQVAQTSAIASELDNLPLSLTFHSITQQVLNITGLMLSLEGPSGQIASSPASASLSYANLSAGTPYELVATGTGTGVAGGTYAIAYNVSAVPLPAALPLFAGALLGLVGFGIKKKRISKSV